MYDDLADLYDRFIGWPARLARELPPLLAWLGEARRVADVACGTGQH
ncbi:MAG: class I SAM-dependent methyltransferase, partial [Armatimonadetes bacterium]|nr:class I SAM-dependent methyltransferase [Armatimonadota bacterium]